MEWEGREKEWEKVKSKLAREGGMRKPSDKLSEKIEEIRERNYNK